MHNRWRVVVIGFVAVTMGCSASVQEIRISKAERIETVSGRVARLSRCTMRVLDTGADGIVYQWVGDPDTASAEIMGSIPTTLLVGGTHRLWPHALSFQDLSGDRVRVEMRGQLGTHIKRMWSAVEQCSKPGGPQN